MYIFPIFDDNTHKTQSHDRFFFLLILKQLVSNYHAYFQNKTCGKKSMKFVNFLKRKINLFIFAYIEGFIR